MSAEPTQQREDPAAGDTAPEGRGRPGRAARWRVTGSTVFFGVVTLLLVGYTVMAFGLEWTTHAGRIGAGFFPRWIGLAGCVLAGVATVLSLRAGTGAEEPDQGADADADPQDSPTGDGERHPGMIVLLGLGLAAFVVLMVPAGAVATGIAFLLASYVVIDRGRMVRGVVLSVCFPVAAFVVLQHWFNAGLPVSPLGFL